MSALTFDAERHEYRWNGERVPNVTSVLAPASDFSRVPQDVLEAAQRRGRYVHRMCELYDLGDLDEEANAAVAEGMFVGYLAAYKRFLDDYEPAWTLIERPMYSQRYRYAGTPDRRGRFGRKRPGWWLVDLKTSVEDSPSWGLQTAAYRQLCAEEDFDAGLDNRATLQLRPDGKYELTPWAGQHDLQVFLGLLTFNHWKEGRL